MDLLLEYIKDKSGKISWSSNFIKKYLLYIESETKKLDLTSKSEFIYYIYHNYTLPNSICKCGNKKKFYSLSNPYRQFCSSKCANKYLMTKERKLNLSKKAKENYNNFSDEKKEKMIKTQIESFKKNWTEDDSKRYSKIMKNKHKNYSEEAKYKISKNISKAVKKSKKAKIQRHNRSKLGQKALRKYINELELFKQKIREKNGILDKDRNTFYQYRSLVRYFTNKNLKEIKDIEKRSKYFHLDHKFSILEGFKQNISPEIIGNNINLEIILSSKNLSKSSKCSISKEELLTSFEKLIGD